MMTISLVEDLWFGDSSDAVAEQNAAAGMAKLSARVLELRSIPGVVLQVVNESRSAEASISQIARLIESEPSFSLRVLRLANSASLGQRVHCTSIRQAVTLLGVKAIAEISMAMAALDLYDDLSPLGCHLREHATIVAGIARHLATRLGLPADNVYTCGLMHDLGKLFLHQTHDPDYAAIVARSGDNADQTHLIERSELGFDHAVLAAHILNAWNIPDPIPTVVAWHHQPARAFAKGGVIAETVSLLRVANRVAHAIQASESTENPIAGLVRDSSADYLGLHEEQLQEWWSELLTVARASREPLAEPLDDLPDATLANPKLTLAAGAAQPSLDSDAPTRPKHRILYWAAGIAALLTAVVAGVLLR